MIDTLTIELNASKDEIGQLKSAIYELKSPSSFFVILASCSLLFSIIAIIMLIIRTNKKADKWEVKDITKELVREQIKGLDIRMMRIESDIKGLGKSSLASKMPCSSNSYDKQILDIELRLGRIEKSFNVASSNFHTYDNHSSQETTAAKESEIMRTGYAKVNDHEYFTEIIESKQEGCVYVIKFISKDEGEFDIISLDKIRSVNDLKEVVDITPDSCLLSEAIDYKLIEKGRCKKVDEKLWEVTKKLTIKVFK